MILQAKNVSFGYEDGGRHILKNFNLTLQNTDCVGLVAPSGFGKTTLCKILAGYEAPDGGEVLLDGRPISSYKKYCPVQMIWQHPEMVTDPRMRMKDVIMEGGGASAHILDGLGIEREWMNRFPGELSGGELQRFCIARALGGEVAFILADEISTMLDLVTQAQIWHFLLGELRRRRIGLLAVSHSELLLEKICGRDILQMANQPE